MNNDESGNSTGVLPPPNILDSKNHAYNNNDYSRFLDTIGMTVIVS